MTRKLMSHEWWDSGIVRALSNCLLCGLRGSWPVDYPVKLCSPCYHKLPPEGQEAFHESKLVGMAFRAARKPIQELGASTGMTPSP